ncbi:MAG: Na+/H+ antiporter NhaA [Planctomycetes bacterium]|nr:Na+/H+ antiporter NhaA [Planctomycetota bacterium]MBI3836244.1 Na+/H+ antiporter NhaA [Planctomycetota bacterium]
MTTSVIARFLKLESAGGMLLMIAALLGMACANLPILSEWYRAVLDFPIEIRLGAFALRETVLLVINDGLMALFFLLVALELKRELLVGELSKLQHVTLPVAAAIGGVLLPAFIYYLFNSREPIAVRGWAIPSATDIAFSLGVLSMLGTRVPFGMKVLLTSIAVIDDLIAIVIIAIFYASELSYWALGLALLGLGILATFSRLRVNRRTIYIFVGMLIWLCVLKSGVHATLAGVAIGLVIPYRGTGESGQPMSLRLQQALHPWVAFLIVPLFAFSNAGVPLRGMTLSVLFGRIPLGIIVGLLVGKPLGISAASFALVRSGIASRPRGCTWASLIGLSILCGVGFTMSLFIGILAFDGISMESENAMRLGVLTGSTTAATIGYIWLKRVLPRDKE